MNKVSSNLVEEKPEPKVPSDLQKILATNPKAKMLWSGLTPIAHRDFISWIESAKQIETRKRRVLSIPSRLLSGKRRPCCYALVPMSFYKALGASPQAKLTWSSLTPTERRDFVSWIDEVKGSEARGLRIMKACQMLAKGRRSH
ncbi:MAG: YdeI/OmpD-associated family protein [Candidatus Paceibacterota bacterium]